MCVVSEIKYWFLHNGALWLEVRGRGKPQLSHDYQFMYSYINLFLNDIFQCVTSMTNKKVYQLDADVCFSPGRTNPLQHAYWEQLGESALFHHTRCAATNPGHRLQHSKKEAWDHQISAAGHLARQPLTQRQRPRWATKTWHSQLTNLLGEACFGGIEINLNNCQITSLLLISTINMLKPHCELV